MSWRNSPIESANFRTSQLRFPDNFLHIGIRMKLNLKKMSAILTDLHRFFFPGHFGGSFCFPGHLACLESQLSPDTEGCEYGEQTTQPGKKREKRARRFSKVSKSLRARPGLVKRLKHWITHEHMLACHFVLRSTTETSKSVLRHHYRAKT